MGEKIAQGIAGVGLAKVFGGKRKSGTPSLVNTGNSTFNPSTGEFNMDPSIRQGQDDFMSSITGAGGFRDQTNSAFDDYNVGLGGLRGDLDEMKGFFGDNAEGFKEAALNPLRQKIASESGRLSTELQRTKVKGSFGNQSRANLALDAGRALSDKTAEIENQRINKLGDLLGMDADLFKAGLDSDTGRTKMLLGLEESLKGISTDRFNQELKLLGLPTGYLQSLQADAGGANSSTGILGQATAGLVGDVIGGAGDFFGGGTDEFAGFEPDPDFDNSPNYRYAD